MANTPSLGDLISVLGSVRGFRFHPYDKAIRKPFQLLLGCSDFTFGPPTPQPCPLAEYVVRFENNAVVLFKALLFFKEFWSTEEFFTVVQECIPNLAKSDKKLELIQNVFCCSRKGYLNNGGSVERSEITALVDEWILHKEAMPPRDPMPNMSRSAWHTFNNETKVEWARKVRNGTFTDAARSLYADDVARRTTRQLSPPTSDAPSTSTVHSDDASPGSSTSVGARNTSREEDVVFLLSLKKDATNKRKRLAESGQSSKRRASGERPQTEVSSPTAHRPKGTRGSGKGKEKATKDITSAQRQRIPSPEPESETEYSSSPPGSPRPGVSHHKPSDRPALPIEGDLQTTVSDLSRRLSKIEQSTLTILERLDNKDNYITKTVAQKLGDKVSSPEFVDKMREILKTVVKEELESMDQSLEKKQRVLGKRLEERVREVDDNMKSLVQHEIKQEVSRVGQKIKMRDLEKIPAMRGTLDDLKDQVELLNGQVQSLGSVKSPSDTAVQGILQRLGEIEGRLRAPEPGYAAPDRRGAAYRDQRERGAPPGVPHGMPGDPSYANDYDEPAGPSYRSRYYSSPVSRYRRAI